MQLYHFGSQKKLVIWYILAPAKNILVSIFFVRCCLMLFRYSFLLIAFAEFDFFEICFHNEFIIITTANFETNRFPYKA